MNKYLQEHLIRIIHIIYIYDMYNYTYIYHLSIISIKYNIIFETFKINLYTDISNNNKIYHM